jgi:hypothetical protein
MDEQVMGLLREISDAADSATWQQVGLDAGTQEKDPTARAFAGQLGLWNFLVVSFSTEDQGNPPGSRGYDGTASKLSGQMTILHLTREIAEKLHKAAGRAVLEGAK